MVTVPGSGWWEASDGKWYPPELHPGYTTTPDPLTVSDVQPDAVGPGFGAAAAGPGSGLTPSTADASIARSLERPEVFERARGLLSARLRTSKIRLATSIAAIVAGIGIALALGLSHPAGQPTPSSIWQPIGTMLLIGGAFAAIASGFMAWLQRRSLAVCAQPAQPFSMSMFKMTVSGLYGTIGWARYMVLYPPEGFGGQPLAVIQVLFGSASFRELPPGALVAVHGDVSKPGSATLVNPGDGQPAGGLIKSTSSARRLLSRAERR